MLTKRFIIVDNDPCTANAITRAIGKFGYAFPVADLSEVGHWPDDCVLFVSDYDRQLDDAMDFVRNLGTFYPIIPFRDQPSPQRVCETIRSGAVGYLGWPCSEGKLASVIDSIGETCDVLFREHAQRERAFALLKTLTMKEKRVLEELTTGRSTKEISRVMGISPRTVEVHRANIFSKLEARNAIVAVRTALETRPPVFPGAAPIH